jgi:DNA-binding transcriptional regulator YiaG
MTEEERKARRREYDRAYRAANRERRRIYNKRWREANAYHHAVSKDEYRRRVMLKNGPFQYAVIEQYRAFAGLTNGQLAAAIGVHNSTLSNYKCGAVRLNVSRIQQSPEFYQWYLQNAGHIRQEVNG